MKSELSFLLDLVLDEQLPAPLKSKLVARVREVEKSYSAQPIVSRGTTRQVNITNAPPIVAVQSPSMQKLMQNNPDLIPAAVSSPITPPMPVTALAAKALADRQALINGAAIEKPEAGRKSPRKF